MLSFERLIVVKRLPGPVSVSVNQGVSGVIVRVACCTRSLSLSALPCAYVTISSKDLGGEGAEAAG